MIISDSEKWVAAQNILHYKKLLADEKDDERRRTLREMIERELTKLGTRRD